MTLCQWSLRPTHQTVRLPDDLKNRTFDIFLNPMNMNALQERLDHNPQASRIRRQTVEHAFGTLKSWMGSTHFLTKTLEKVSTEMSLHVLAYNMKRMFAIHGTLGLMRVIQA